MRRLATRWAAAVLSYCSSATQPAATCRTPAMATSLPDCLACWAERPSVETKARCIRLPAASAGGRATLIPGMVNGGPTLEHRPVAATLGLPVGAARRDRHRIREDRIRLERPSVLAVRGVAGICLRLRVSLVDGERMATLRSDRRLWGSIRGGTPPVLSRARRGHGLRPRDAVRHRRGRMARESRSRSLVERRRGAAACRRPALRPARQAAAAWLSRVRGARRFDRR